MLSRCETHDGTCGEGWGLAERWLHPETLESLVELNELCLGLFAEQAAVRCAQPSLRQIHSLAQTHQAWLKPRWPARVQVWRELLLAAASGEAPVLERARLHGLTLLAADARAALPERADPGALAP